MNVRHGFIMLGYSSNAGNTHLDQFKMNLIIGRRQIIVHMQEQSLYQEYSYFSIVSDFFSLVLVLFVF